MNNVRSLVRAARNPGNRGPGLYSDPMLIELLALHEEMIEQLRLERLEVVGNADFLTAMIDQHEKTAEMLRARLHDNETATTNVGTNGDTNGGTNDIAGGGQFRRGGIPEQHGRSFREIGQPSDDNEL